MIRRWSAGSPRLHLAITVVSLMSLGGALIAGQVQAPATDRSSDGVWQAAAERLLAADAIRPDLAGPFAVARLDKNMFDAIAGRAPGENMAADAAADVILTLPMPDGTFSRFKVRQSPILSSELAAAFPEIATYRGQGIDDPAATTRFGWTQAGFHAIVLSDAGSVFVDPLVRGQLDYYVSFRKQSARNLGSPFLCLVSDRPTAAQLRPLGAFPFTNGATLRTYRLALAATGEYTVAAGGTKALALARMTTTMNRVNGVYERDLSVRLTVATGTPGDPTALIYTNGSTDPYSNNDGVAMLSQNQANLDAVVGSANYDIGHVFSTGGGGIADVGAVCTSGVKGEGVTGSSNPTGDAFDIDFVAHEIGHQFGANHTFNGTSSGCGGGNRNAGTAYEVGSGSTIMAYAGVCQPEDLQPDSNDQFHVKSLDEITAFLTSGLGATCGTATTTGNALPVVSGGSNYTVPQQTPVSLTATGTDANGDALTYQWDQLDLGTFSSSVATASTDDGFRPLFRSYLQTSSPSRTLPSLTYILNNANAPPATHACAIGTCLTGETLASTNRTLHFQVVARDNRSGGGAIATSSAQVTVTTAAGPFRVTSPNTAVSWASGSQIVAWNVAGTTASPVSAANVKISLSADGGTTFPYVLAASTANTGTATVTIPGVATATARIKIESVGNIFFDVSDANFTITGPPAAPALVTNPSNQAVGSGGFASFTAVADGSPAPSVQWQVSANSGATWLNITGATSSTYSLTVTTADNTKQYRAVFTNASGTATSSAATLTVYGPTIANPSVLNFGAVKSGVTLSSQTATQTVTISFSGAVSAWTATTSQTWLSVTGGSGSGAGQFTVAIQNPGDVIGASTSLAGAITVTSPTAPNSPMAIPVNLNVVTAATAAAPIGFFDLPTNGATGLEGSFPVTGWAIDDVGISKVMIYRNFVGGIDPTAAANSTPGDPAFGQVYVADALFVSGTRGDIEAAYASYPFAYRAGWGYLLLSWGLPDQGNSTYTLYAYAYDVDGHVTPLGSKTIGVDNAHATKPFGAIDSPSYGGTASGPSFANFGWALTPNHTPACKINNGSVGVSVDSATPVAVDYGLARSDIALKFPGFSNTSGGGGLGILNTTLLANGMHTISWVATDDCGRSEGMGSRYFWVLNTGADLLAAPPGAKDSPAWASPIAAARATSVSSAPVAVRQQDGAWQQSWPNNAGTRVIEAALDSRVEVQLPPLAGGMYSGYEDVGTARRDLPVGSSLDAHRGIFYWQPGPGFVGRYDLVFGPSSGSGALVRTRFVVGPAVRIGIDVPSNGAETAGQFTLAGWALDLAAREGTGIDAVHAWAYPVGGGSPIWLGIATYGGARPDVAAVYGPAATGSAFTLDVDQLPAGTYDIIVYARRAGTGAFDASQSARVTVK